MYSNTCAEDDDDTNTDTITNSITITDAGVSIDSGQTANLLESAADDDRSYHINNKWRYSYIIRNQWRRY